MDQLESPPQPFRPSRRALTALLLGALVALTGQCAPDPRTVHCSNDAECTDRSGSYNYCVRGRCAECVTNAACGAHRRCAAGFCKP